MVYAWLHPFFITTRLLTQVMMMNLLCWLSNASNRESTTVTSRLTFTVQLCSQACPVLSQAARQHRMPRGEDSHLSRHLLDSIVLHHRSVSAQSCVNTTTLIPIHMSTNVEILVKTDPVYMRYANFCPVLFPGVAKIRPIMQIQVLPQNAAYLTNLRICSLTAK